MAEEAPAVAQELATIERQVGTPTYFADEPLQQRYRDLLTARETGAAPPARPGPAAARIAAIERMMADPKSEYWRGPTAERIQAEYRALLAGEAPGSAGTADASAGAASGEVWATPAQARQQLPAAVVQAWERDGDFIGSLGRLQQSVGTLVQAVGEPMQAEHFLQTFREMPEGARAAVIREAARMDPGYVVPATDEELALFRGLHGGRELADAWGPGARRSVAAVSEAFDRLKGAMTPTDWAGFGRWYRGLTVAGRQALLWRLGAV